MVDDISHEGLRLVLHDEDVSVQAVKTVKASTDPDYEAKTSRVLELYAIADGLAEPGPADPTVVFCVDEFGPLNLQPHPGRQWPRLGTAGAIRPLRVAVGGGRPTPARRASGICSPHSTWPGTGSMATSPGASAAPSSWPSAATCVPSIPADMRIAIVCDNFSPHLSTRTDDRVGRWAAANNVEIAYTPFYGSWLNRIEAQFTALRYFILDGTDHASHREQHA